MTWVILDDAFSDHPKIDGLSDGAFRLHVSAIVYCGRLLTDGYVSSERAPRLMPGYRKAYVAELERAELWDQADAGWQIHNYLHYQQSAEQVRAKTAARAAAGKTGGVRSGQSRRSKNEANASSKNEANASLPVRSKTEARGLNPIPSHPKLQTSSSSPPLLATAPDEEEDGPIGKAATIGARQRLAARVASCGPVVNEALWLQSVRKTWLEEHATLARRLLQTDAARTPADLVRLCESVTPPGQTRTVRPPCAACEDRGWTGDDTPESPLRRCACVQQLETA